MLCFFLVSSDTSFISSVRFSSNPSTHNQNFKTASPKYIVATLACDTHPLRLHSLSQLPASSPPAVALRSLAPALLGARKQASYLRRGRAPLSSLTHRPHPRWPVPRCGPADGLSVARTSARFGGVVAGLAGGLRAGSAAALSATCPSILSLNLVWRTSTGGASFGVVPACAEAVDVSRC